MAAPPKRQLTFHLEADNPRGILQFIRHLEARTRLRFLVAGSLYIGGAIVVEAIGGSYAERAGMNNLTYNVITTVEESLEMVGLTVFIWALLRYCADTYRDVLLQFSSKVG